MSQGISAIHITTSKNAIVDICIYIVDIHNDIFPSHNVFLDIQNYILDIWNSFFIFDTWNKKLGPVSIGLKISEMGVFPSMNSIADIQNVHSRYPECNCGYLKLMPNTHE